MGGTSKLTDSRIRAAKPKDRQYKIADGGGLFLLVKPNGGKYWRLKFRFAGREKLLSLGVYPATSLADARERRDAERKLLADGLDPSRQRIQRKREARAADANTFEAVAREWHATKAPEWVETTVKNTMGLLERDLLPWLGRRPIAELEAADVLECAERVVRRGSTHTAGTVLRVAGNVFRYAVRKRLIKSDPTRDLAGALPAAPVKHRAAITDPARLGALLRAIDGYAGTLPVRIALQLAPLVFVRPGELRAARWEEFDLDRGEWVIPASRMKLRETHIVPLAPQAVALLRELSPLTHRGPTSYVFPGARDQKRPMSENTINAALRGLGYDSDTMSAHGFRATARTILHERLEFDPDVIEAQLSHAVPDRLGRAYNRSRHLPARRDMMAAWANYLDKLRVGADIVELRPAAKDSSA